MFSQFRNAVEHLAQQPLRSISQDSSSSSPLHERSTSTDSLGVSPSSEQLGGSALVNLRKTLAVQRSASPKTNSPNSPDQSKPRSRLEERLRASLSFTIGEASSPNTPGTSTGDITPNPPPKDVLSPESIPLPDSPVDTPRVEAMELPQPLKHLVIPEALVQPKPVRAEPEISTAETLEAAADDNDEEDRHIEAEFPLPDSPAVDRFEKPPAPEPVPTPVIPDTNEADVETLRQQLKRFKERFTDVSSSFKRLQAEKFAVDRVLQEFTPLQSMNDSAGLREYIENMSSQAEMSQDEIKRLSGKLLRQDERIEELRDTHKLESKSQSEQIDKLHKQMEETEVLLKASQSTETNKKDESQKTNAEMEKLKAEAEKFKTIAAQEEEKRTKAIVLLKTVRQKLVKAEKERDDAMREVNDLKEKDRVEKIKEKSERLKLQQEIEQVNLEREKAVAGLKAQFDREVSNLKDRKEKETSALKGQYELEAITLKSANTKELEARNQQIYVLESSVQNLTRDKDGIFDQLQMRQAELESAQGHMESLQSQTTEFQYQIREFNERNALLTEELAEARTEYAHVDKGAEISAEEVARLLSGAEAKYETRLADLRKQLDAIERERNDADSDWSSKFSVKSKEVEELKRTINSGAKNRADHEQAVLGLKADVERLKEEIRNYQKQSSDLQRQAEKVKDIEETAQMHIVDATTRNKNLEKQAEDAQSRETQLRASNKTLREELRKVQSSAALLEKQRNPGLGYWASRENVTESRTSISSNSDRPSQMGSPTASSQQISNDEEVNLEYLRNVVLQFLEHKEMRPNLVRILTTILRFTPQETRRLSRAL